MTPPKSELRRRQLIAHDQTYWEQGTCFAGLDEAGRGPLAGCVMAACVIMPSRPLVPWVDDSKRLSEKRREALYECILETALFVGLGRASSEEIDQVNILQATRLAMQRAAQGCPADFFLVDAVKGLVLPGKMRSIIRGDATSYSIAAASIVAKVARDREMRALDHTFPQYDFAANKGYGTPGHMAALREHGPCPAHRRTFITRVISGP